jgi:hypothetical protein
MSEGEDRGGDAPVLTRIIGIVTPREEARRLDFY